MLDSLNRQGLGNYDWAYRFVNYDIPGKNDQEADHVYVVLLESDTWLDPALLKDVKTDQYYERFYNDRLAIPDYYLDIKSTDMLSHLSGVHYTVKDENETSACGCADTVGVTSSDEPGAIETVVGVIRDTAKQIADLLPDGGLKDWLNSFFDNPGKAIVTLIKGRKYASQDYALGEIFMRNILGMSEIQSRRQVPDEYVPLASQFFTLALAVEVGSADHLDQLVKSADAYYQWMPVEVDQATPRANAERASRILKSFNYGPATRDMVWPLSWFLKEPYVYPIPDVEPGYLFSGKHPITKEIIVNGYPETPKTDTNPDKPLPMPNGTPDNGGESDKKTNWLLYGGIAVAAVLLLTKKKKRRA